LRIYSPIRVLAGSNRFLSLKNSQGKKELFMSNELQFAMLTLMEPKTHVRLVCRSGKYLSYNFDPSLFMVSGLFSSNWLTKDERSGTPAAVLFVEVTPVENGNMLVFQSTVTTRLIDGHGNDCNVTVHVTNDTIISITYTPVPSGSASTANTETQAEIAGATSGDCGRIQDDDCDVMLVIDLDDAKPSQDDSYDAFVDEVIKASADPNDIIEIEIVDPDTGADTGLVEASTGDFDFMNHFDPQPFREDVEDVLFVGTTLDEDDTSESADGSDDSDADSSDCGSGGDSGGDSGSDGGCGGD